MKILIIRMGAMGDIVHTLPSAATLRATFPNAEIDWLVDEHWMPLLEGNPHISTLLPFRKRDWRALLRTMGELRDRRYDTVIDFQGLLKSAFLAGNSAAAEVIGFGMAALREKLAAAAYDRAVNVPLDLHVVEQNLALARAAGAIEDVMEFPLPKGVTPENVGGNFLAVSPSAGWAAKRWPAEQYARLIQIVFEQRGWPAVVNCGPGEEKLADRVAELARPARVRIVQGGITGLIGLARAARVFVAGDTGPLHVAAAVGTPVVAVFGPTSPRRNGPFTQRARVVRADGVTTTYSRSATVEDVARVSAADVYDALNEVA